MGIGLRRPIAEGSDRSRSRAVPHRLARPASRPLLRAAAVSALVLGSALPAAAQVLIYEGQPGLAPRGYPVPPGAYPPGAYPPGGAFPVPQARYPVLPPEEIRAIVQSLGYWNIGAPKLSGRFYLVAAADQEGRALLRVNAFTGRVVSARAIPGGPAVAAPAPAPAPQRATPQRPAPPAVARAPSAPPPVPSSDAASVAGTPAPLPPQRPPEATMAAVTPAPSVVPSAAPAAVAPAAPAAAATPPAPGASANAPAGQTAAQQSATAAPSATPAQPAQPQKRKAGAGTATTDSAAAGTASVLSRPKSP